MVYVHCVENFNRQKRLSQEEVTSLWSFSRKLQSSVGQESEFRMYSSCSTLDLTLIWTETMHISHSNLSSLPNARNANASGILFFVFNLTWKPPSFTCQSKLPLLPSSPVSHGFLIPSSFWSPGRVKPLMGGIFKVPSHIQYRNQGRERERLLTNTFWQLVSGTIWKIFPLSIF